MDIYWLIDTLELAKPCGNGKYPSRPDVLINQPVNQQEDQLEGFMARKINLGAVLGGEWRKTKIPDQRCVRLCSVWSNRSGALGLFGVNVRSEGLSEIAQLALELSGGPIAVLMESWPHTGVWRPRGFLTNEAEVAYQVHPEAGSLTPPVPTTGRILAMASHEKFIM